MEQPPVQVTLQIEPGLHEMLPLAPSVIEQLACSPQSTLHESPHAPAQVDCAAQPSVQLPPHVWVVTSQLVPVMQAQVVPVHTGAGLLDPPQAFAARTMINSDHRSVLRITTKRFSVMISKYREPRRIRQPLATERSSRREGRRVTGKTSAV